MAERLVEYEIPERGAYPWDEWTDGSVWRVVWGEDFKISPFAFKGSLSRVASRKGMRIRTVQEDDRTVVFQFLPRGDG